MGILEVFRSKVAYIISVGAFVPAYYYLSSDRFKLKNDYQQEFVTQQFGTQNLSFAESAAVKNVNIAHSMAHQEVEELKKARHNTYRFSHLYGRTYENPESSSEDRKDIPLSAPMQDKVDGRIMRSRQRAMERLRSGEQETE